MFLLTKKAQEFMPYFELYMQEKLEKQNKKKQSLEPKSIDTKQ
jgi:hypothetical protein